MQTYGRRDVLRYSGAAAALALGGPALVGAARAAQPIHDFNNRVLVLIEFNGGNDGLNTVVPYADPAYAAARPTLALPRDQVIQLDEQAGLHPALEPLSAAWRDGDLAIVQGVGYERPDRSHFRSIDIWNTASDAAQYLADGWVARSFTEASVRRDLVADGFVISGDNGPLFGGDLRAVKLNDPDRFVDRAGRVTANSMPNRTSALDHILQTQTNVIAVADDLSQRLRNSPELGVEFPTTGQFGAFGREMEIAAQIISSNIPVAVIKVSLGSFDTHAGQANLHRNLLDRFATSVSAFRQAMQNTGHWNRVLLMTYAEFGRRVGQNGSNGTDHGTAAAHFVHGGRVNGGLFGVAPSLTDLDGGDLKHAVDFREMFATATQSWWGLPPTNQTFGGRRPIVGLVT